LSLFAARYHALAACTSFGHFCLSKDRLELCLLDPLILSGH
jgi:hypothetical protein